MYCRTFGQRVWDVDSMDIVDDRMDTLWAVCECD